MVAGLLFCSGFSALIYQTVWFRELRLIFGASTLATAAVLAIFMAGLGVGSAVLGKRADVRTAPLAFYARLELLIAGSAMLSLLLLWIVRAAYIAIGGSPRLGIAGATIVRLILALLVLGAPTVLMGGTLPAAARAVESNKDPSRRSVALLYAINTLGAVAGTLLSTFVLLEIYGNRRTLLIAALVNVLVALTARAISRRTGEAVDIVDPEPIGTGEVPAPIVLVAAAAAGFSFLLMELVWYRMLGPLLGGTTFTFGLILAFALAGIGIGGLAYRAVRPTAGALAFTSSAEALAMIVPFAIGDRLALLTSILRQLRAFGFGSYMLGWSAVVAITVLPAAIAAGIQFPLLIGLLGRGRKLIGRDVGQAYAWNTAGAIAGSLAGGFGLLPLLSAPGAWRLAAIILALLGVVIAFHAFRVAERASAVAACLFAILTIAAAATDGPTAVWRHGGIGIGLLSTPLTLNEWRDDRNDYRRRLIWEEDGRESSVAIVGGDDLSFVVNGKPDGSATGDAGTQVMGGLIGAILHAAPRSALVIGLGTGSTSGWLGSVPSIERVDAVELEPVVLRVARDCAGVNQHVLENPKVHITIGDAREVLLTTGRRYDVIFSEPSNPYRAGVASLFTSEFYRAAADRLAPGGIFLQWVQAYDIDALTLRTIYTTIGGVYPHVDTFWPLSGDLLLVATREPLTYDIDRLRQRLGTEPYRAAAAYAWGVTTAEGFLSHFVGNEAVARSLGSHGDAPNTDDRTVIEYSFARALLADRGGVSAPLVDMADRSGQWRPAKVRGAFDWRAQLENRAAVSDRPLPPDAPADLRNRHDFAAARESGDLKKAAAIWKATPFQPVNLIDTTGVGESLADTGDATAARFAESLRSREPVVANAILGRLMMAERRFDAAAELLRRAFVGYRSTPWPDSDLMRRSTELAIAVCRLEPKYAPMMYTTLGRPFATGQNEHSRQVALLTIASDREGCGAHTIAALKLFEPYPPWRRDHLALRVRCYAAAGLHDLAESAREDLEDFDAAAGEPLIK